MSKNSPSLKLRRSKLRRSSIEGLRLVRVFRLKPSIQNGVFCCFAKCRTTNERELIPTVRPVGLTGLEPVTLRLSSACSNQLSYRPR